MFEKLRTWFRPGERHAKQQEVMINLIDMFRANRPLSDVWDVRRFVDEGYRRNSLIFACVTIKANSFAQPELIAHGTRAGDEELDLPAGHMLVKLLGTGMISGYDKAGRTPRGSQSAFFRRWSTHLDVCGNAYAFIVRNAQGMPLAVRLLSRPDVMRPVIDGTGTVIEYQYGIEPNVQRFQPHDVIHEMAAPDPLEPWRGISPIAVLSRMGDLDNFAGDYLRAFFLNAGIPSGLLKLKSQQVPREERDRIKAQWRDQYGRRPDPSTGGWFDVAVLDADVEYQEIGSKLRTMDLEQVFGQTESRICGAFAVHPILVAAWIGLDKSTYANYEHARRSLYNDTMLPVWTSTADRLTTDLAAEFGDDIVLQFALDEVPELQRDRTEQKKLTLDAWDKGLLTRNEGRAAWDLEAVANGDVFKVGAADMFEPGTVVAERQRSLAGASERLSLPVHTEKHAAGIDDWKRLHAIADKAVPALKKKSLPQLHALRSGSR